MNICIRSCMAVLLVALTVSCQSRRLVVGQFVSVLEAGVSAIENETDIDLLNRSFPTQIKLLETLLVNDPENGNLRILLSRLYGGFAFSGAETQLEQELPHIWKEPERKKTADALRADAREYYQRGAGYALSALSLSYPECEKRMHRIPEVQPLLDSMKKEDVPALFWYGFNLAAWINLSRNDTSAVAKAYLVEKIMKRVITLDETYYYGSAHLVLQSYYASRPPMMGGKPEAAAFHYKRIKDLGGDRFFLPDLFFAQTVLVRQQDRPAFEKTLGRVLDQEPAKTPYPMLNQIAVLRARAVMSEAGHLFQ